MTERVQHLPKLPALLALAACPADDGYDDQPAQPVPLLGAIAADEHPGTALLDAPWPVHAHTGAGDINGDGMDDLIVGVFVHNEPVDGAFVLFGSTEPLARSQPLALAGLHLRPRGGSNLFAMPLGDVDGDGRDDLAFDALGAPLVLPGREALVDDRSPYDMPAREWGVQIALTTNADLFAVGDVDGDDLADIGLRTDDGIRVVTGHDALLDTDRLLLFEASTPLAEPPDGPVHWALGRPGDLDGDGLNDVVVVRQPDYDASIPRSLEVFYGRPAPDVPGRGAPDARFTLDASSHYLGMGDLDGDGIDDIMVGVGETRLLTGRRQRFEGQLAIDTLTVSIVGEQLRRATWVGDIDGDGAEDIVGLPAAADELAIWYGRNDLTSLPAERAATLQFDEPAEWFRVSALGDLNGDGCDEFATTPTRPGLRPQPIGGVSIFYGAPRP